MAVIIGSQVLLPPYQELGKLLARWDAAWDAAHAAKPAPATAAAPRRRTSIATLASISSALPRQAAARGIARRTGSPAGGVQTPPAGALASNARTPPKQAAAQGATWRAGLPTGGLKLPPAGTGAAGRASCSGASSRGRTRSKSGVGLVPEQGPELAGLPVMYSPEERAIYKCT